MVCVFPWVTASLPRGARDSSGCVRRRVGTIRIIDLGCVRAIRCCYACIAASRGDGTCARACSGAVVAGGARRAVVPVRRARRLRWTGVFLCCAHTFVCGFVCSRVCVRRICVLCVFRAWRCDAVNARSVCLFVLRVNWVSPCAAMIMVLTRCLMRHVVMSCVMRHVVSLFVRHY